LAAISLSPSGGVKNAPILRYVSGLWSPFLTANPARDVSVTSWDDNDYMLCYDNGAISIENSPSVSKRRCVRGVGGVDLSFEVRFTADPKTEQAILSLTMVRLMQRMPPSVK
jgi:hypothetical protein